MINKKVVLAGIIFLGVIILGFLVVSNWRTGNVIANFEQVQVGSKLTGTLDLTIEANDHLSGETPLIFSITRGSKVDDVKTLTLKEFVALSDKSNIQQDPSSYSPGKYSVPLTALSDFTFETKGNYEIYFSMPKIGYVVKREIKAE